MGVWLKPSCYVVKAGVCLMTALIAGSVGCYLGRPCPTPPPSQNLEIRTWYDLDSVRNNLQGNHILMNDLDSTTLGYDELASPTANQGKGWQPIGTFIPMCDYGGFMGTLDGQGHEIRDLYINRPDERLVGLFGCVAGGVIEHVAVLNLTVIGKSSVGGLVGRNMGTISRCSVIGNVSGNFSAGGLVGYNEGPIINCYAAGNVFGGGVVGNVSAVVGGFGVGGLIGLSAREEATVSSCHFTGNVTSSLSFFAWHWLGGVGGLVGASYATVNHCYADANVTGTVGVGGLVGRNLGGTISNCYFAGRVTGTSDVGGLVASNGGGVSVANSFYNYDKVLINGENMITVGALFGEDFGQWMANGKFLDVKERLSQKDGYYLINDVKDLKQLLAFGQNASLKFRLTNDLDLATRPNFYVPYLAGEFDGNGHKISNLSLNYDLATPLGLFGYLAPGGKVIGLGLENINITGHSSVGGLVGSTQEGTVRHCYSTGTVTGKYVVGGLVGQSSFGTVSDSYSTAIVTGNSVVGGLVGGNGGTVSNSHSIGNVTGEGAVGGLVGSNVRDVTNSYSTSAVAGDESIGGLVGLNRVLGSVSGSRSSGRVNGNKNVGGLVGMNEFGTVSSSYSTGAVTGVACVGGLVGCSNGGMATVTRSYSTGNVVGNEYVGGLVGWGLDGTTVSDSYCTGNVTGLQRVGGLVGALGSSDYLKACAVDMCYSTGAVTGSKNVGGLVGEAKNRAAVTSSFWDMQTSGKVTSAGGTGKTTAEMKDVSTYSAAHWPIIAVASSDARNTFYIWNIVNGVTYPFLSWEP